MGRTLVVIKLHVVEVGELRLGHDGISLGARVGEDGGSCAATESIAHPRKKKGKRLTYLKM